MLQKHDLLSALTILRPLRRSWSADLRERVGGNAQRGGGGGGGTIQGFKSK